LLICASWTKIYDQDLEKNAKNEIDVHYEFFLKTKILGIRHKQHFEFQYKFRPWDGHQMVNIESLILCYNLNLD
jgi:hypothetical protein